MYSNSFYKANYPIPKPKPDKGITKKKSTDQDLSQRYT
jgi:hypothetical protein